MRLTMIGCNHKSADITLREQLAFSPEQVVVALHIWAKYHAQYEAVLLSTCNRTELYVASENGTIPDAPQICRFLCEVKNIPVETLQHALTQLHDDDVVSHLFEVAGSLDSMVVGEPQVLSQVKAAYQLADEAGTTGPIMHGLFQASLKTAKRIVAETEIHQRRVSIPSVAVVDFALQIFEQLDDKKTLVLGAGEMADETLRYLTGHGAKMVIVINRNRDRAEALARQWQGQTDLWENRVQRLAGADLVVSATGASEPVVRLDDYLAVEPLRKGKPLFVLDLAVPRDFDPAIGKRDGVFLYAIDDLKEACEHNRVSRNRELPRANRIIKQESGRFLREMRHRATGDVIRQLQAGWSEIKNVELARLFNKMPNLTEEEQAEVRYAFERLINKLLHPPLESLRDEAKHGVPGMLLDALAQLFRLKD
ncbi:MAG: glutamyl-tRNA reductase [Planctomycetaceae bacterium]|nr:glutamyl-tRNA reductase [Planctomycetaceae bacterium]